MTNSLRQASLRWFFMDAKSVIGAFLLLVITYLPAFTLVSFIVLGNLGFASAVKSNPWMPIPIVISVTLCMAMLLITIVGRRRFAQYGFKTPKGSDLWKALSIGLLVGILLDVAGELGGAGLTFMGQPPFAYVILLLWIGAPIQEEIIFRGLFQSYLALHIKSSITIWKWKLTLPTLVGAITFSLVHVALLSVEASLWGVLVSVVGAFILGIIAGYFRAETGSLIGPIIVHALFNITGTVFEFLTFGL
jgi:membrane protease YdiL (CAAX protease family)